MTPPAPDDAPLVDRLEALAAFLPIFEAPGFVFATWGGGEEVEPGVHQMPYCSLSTEALRFLDAAYQAGWVVPGFDWSEWAGTPEGEALLAGPQGLAQATPEQLARVLTVLIRLDRFSEGRLLEAYRTGYLTAILRRAAELRDEAVRACQP